MTRFVPCPTWAAIIERDVLAGEDFLLIQRDDGHGNQCVVAPLTLLDHIPGRAEQPTLSGPGNDVQGLLQALLDAAWARGMRPRGHEGPDELKAVTRHLEDMRAMAFAKIGVEAP
jgi:hypothetical protein